MILSGGKGWRAGIAPIGEVDEDATNAKRQQKGRIRSNVNKGISDVNNGECSD